MRDYSNADFADASVRRQILSELEDIERQAAVLDREARHDVTNAAGAARNAIILMDDRTTTLSFGRLVDIAARNAALATELLRVERLRSAGDERHDLGGTRERNDADAFGL